MSKVLLAALVSTCESITKRISDGVPRLDAAHKENAIAHQALFINAVTFRQSTAHGTPALSGVRAV
eukprot:5299319-Prymnesium_polylepis.1